MDHDTLRADLKRDEGVVLKPYRDAVNKLSIGVGRNLDDNGISYIEALFLLDNDIGEAEKALRTNLIGYDDLDEPVQRALCNMVFNLGWPRFATFKKMIAALEAKDFETAAQEALDSKWAKQVGARATRIANLLRGHDLNPGPAPKDW